MKKFTFTLLTAVLVVSCNKDKKAIKEIDGQWKEIRSEIIAGEFVLESEIDPLYMGGDFYFYTCNSKKEAYCDLLIKYYSEEDTAFVDFPYEFIIKDKVDSLLIKEGVIDTAYVNRFKIESIGENDLVLRQEISGDTAYQRVFSRIE